VDILLMLYQWHSGCFTKFAITKQNISDCGIYLLNEHISILLFEIFHESYQIKTFIDGTTIEVYKHVYKCHSVDLQSGLSALVIQPAMQAIGLCWLGLTKQAWYTTKCQKCSITVRYRELCCFIAAQ